MNIPFTRLSRPALSSASTMSITFSGLSPIPNGLRDIESGMGLLRSAVSTMSPGRPSPRIKPMANSATNSRMRKRMKLAMPFSVPLATEPAQCRNATMNG